MRRRLDIPPLPFLEPSGMYYVSPDGRMIPAGEEGGEEMGVIGLGVGGGQDYVSRAKYVVGELESPEGETVINYGRKLAKLERAVNDLKGGIPGAFDCQTLRVDVLMRFIGDDDERRRRQAEALLDEYVSELERTRAAATAAGHTISVDGRRLLFRTITHHSSLTHAPPTSRRPPLATQCPSLIPQCPMFTLYSRRPTRKYRR